MGVGLKAIEMYEVVVLQARILNSSISRTVLPLTCQGEAAVPSYLLWSVSALFFGTP